MFVVCFSLLLQSLLQLLLLLLLSEVVVLPLLLYASHSITISSGDVDNGGYGESRAHRYSLVSTLFCALRCCYCCFCSVLLLMLLLVLLLLLHQLLQLLFLTWNMEEAETSHCAIMTVHIPAYTGAIMKLAIWPDCRPRSKMTLVKGRVMGLTIEIAHITNCREVC